MHSRFTVLARMHTGEIRILGNYLSEGEALRAEAEAFENERVDEALIVDWWDGITV